MNTFWMIVAGVVVIATGKVLLFGEKPTPAASISTPEAHEVTQESHASKSRTRFPLLSSSDPFDNDGALVWSTQVQMLGAIWANEPIGMSCAQLRPIYSELAHRYPEIYDGHTFQQWGELLLKLDLLRVHDKRVHITHAGRALHNLLMNVAQQDRREPAPEWSARLKSD